MKHSIVDVNIRGITDEGDDTTMYASAEQVCLGHMINVPILAQYPDGEIRDGNLLKITPKGLEWLRDNLPADLRRTSAIR